MASVEEDMVTSAPLAAPSKGCLDIRDVAYLRGRNSHMQSPTTSCHLQSTDAPLPDVLLSNVSTTSHYDTSGMQSSCGGAPVTIAADIMQCIFDLMHEVRRDNKLQRALRGEARAAYSRVEALQRDNARLSAQLKTVTGDRSVAQGTTISPAESTGRELGECGEGLKTPPPFWPTTGVLPFGSLARPASAALCSGEAASSLDGRSHKSDGLTGDEVETLHGQANERKQLKQALSALVEERRKVQRLESRVNDLEAASKLPPSTGSGYNTRALETVESNCSGDTTAPSRRFNNFLQGLWSQSNPLERRFTDGIRRQRASDTNVGASTISEDDIMQDLAATKIALAEMQGELSAARRDLARVREESAAARVQGGAYLEERDKAWEEVGTLMVQLHVLQSRNEVLIKGLGGQEAADALLAAEGSTPRGVPASGRGSDSGDSSMASPHPSLEAAATVDGAATGVL